MHSHERIAEVIRAPLPTRPRLAPWLTLVDLGEGRLQLRGAEYAFTVPDPLLSAVVQHLAPRLDGETAAETLMASGEGVFAPEVISLVLKMLSVRGAVYDAALEQPEGEGPSRAICDALSALTRQPVAAAARLACAQVALTGADPLLSEVEAGLQAVGVAPQRWTASPDRWPEEADAELLVVAHPSGTAGGYFEAVNAATLKMGQRWLRLTFEGSTGVLGPTIVPRQTACHTCYVARLATHRGAQEHLQWRAAQHDAEPAPVLPPLRQALAGQAVMEVVRLITGVTPPLTYGRLYTVDALGPGSAGHEVLRLPRCPACGRAFGPRDPWDRRSVNPGGRR